MIGEREHQVYRGLHEKKERCPAWPAMGVWFCSSGLTPQLWNIFAVATTEAVTVDFKWHSFFVDYFVLFPGDGADVGKKGRQPAVSIDNEKGAD